MTQKRPETVLLRKVVAFLSKTNLTWYFTGPDPYLAVLAKSGNKYLLGIAKKKAAIMGSKSGIPDICICDPPPAKPGCHGCYIELKAKKNGLTKAQKEWRDDLQSKGYHVGLVRDSLDNFKIHLVELGYKFRGSKTIAQRLSQYQAPQE